MPHLIVEYSANLAERADFSAIVDALRVSMVETGVFPLAGIRVRAYPATAFAVADGDAQNGFVHLTLRMGQGRDDETRHAAGAEIFATAQTIFGDLLATGHFALSMEIVEIDALTSWKANPIHARLAAENGSERGEI